MKILKKDSWKFIISVFIVFILIFFYNALTPLFSDDIFYKSDVLQAQSLGDLLLQEFNEYMSHSGRVIGLFSTRLSVIADKMFFNIINSIMFVLLSLLIYWNITGKKKFNLPMYLLSVLIIWRYSVDFDQTILWLCGSCNYLWGTVFILGFVTLYRHILNKEKIVHPVRLSILLFFYGIIAGWCNENTSGGGLLLIIMFTGLKWWKSDNKKHFFRPYMFAAHLGMVCGLLALVLAPGNYGRAGMMSDTENYSGILGYLSRLYKCFVAIDQLFLELLIICVCMIILSIVYRKKLNDVIENVAPFLISFFATALVLILIPTPMNRAYFGAGVFLMIACLQSFFYVFGDVGKRLSSAIKYCIISIMLISFFFVYSENLVNLARIYREDTERSQLIQQAVEQGCDEVVIPQYRDAFRNPYSAAHDSDMQEDPQYWINVFYESYYDIESIIAIPRDEWDAKYGNH